MQLLFLCVIFCINSKMQAPKGVYKPTPFANPQMLESQTPKKRPEDAATNLYRTETVDFSGPDIKEGEGGIKLTNVSGKLNVSKKWNKANKSYENKDEFKSLKTVPRPENSAQ